MIHISFPFSMWRHFQRVSSLLEAGDLVLDLGCGRGSMQRFLWQTKGCKCIGLDIVDKGFSGLKHLFVHGDGTCLPFRDGVFDVVMSHEFMSHVRDPISCLKEQIRVLKRGGRVIMSDGNLLSPVTVFDLVFLYPLRTRGRSGGLKWLRGLGRGIVYANYKYGTPQKDEEIRTRYYWCGLFHIAGLKAITFPFRVSYIASIYMVATKETSAADKP